MLRLFSLSLLMSLVCSTQHVYGATITIVGDIGTILQSNNNGVDWIPRPSGTTRDLRGVDFPDADTGWAVGEFQATSNPNVSFDTILRTDDGGEHWQSTVSQGSQQRFNGHDVDFVGTDTGWMVGGIGRILHTTNGGMSWTEQPSGEANVFFGMDFVDANNGWVVGSGGLILNTSNGGADKATSLL